MASKLSVGTTRAGDTTILTPNGDIDINSQPDMAAALKNSASETGVQRLVVDLTGVPYMDSSGVATLIKASQDAKKRGHKLVLAAPQARVSSILQIAKLSTFFAIAPSVDEAKLR